MALVLKCVLALLTEALYLQKESVPVLLHLILNVPHLVALAFRALLLRLELSQVRDLALLGGHLEGGSQLLRKYRGYGDLQAIVKCMELTF